MDPTRFDNLARAFVSRRTFVAALGALLVADPGGASAHRAGKRCTKAHERCKSLLQCCGHASGGVGCEPFASDPGSGKEECRGTTLPVCCYRYGNTCRNSCECCGSMLCLNGLCGCVPPAGRCASTDDCCATGEGFICAYVASKEDIFAVEDLALVCPPGLACCLTRGHSCKSTCQCCGSLVCQSTGEPDSYGKCQDVGPCGPGTVPCSSGCADLTNDFGNCGACGNVCPPGQFCHAGACTSLCPGPTIRCNEVCVDPETDPSNCGACDTRCTGGEPCVNGACVPRPCAEYGQPC